MVDGRHTVADDAAAHQEHGSSAHHRQRLHQVRRQPQDAVAAGLREAADLAAQVQAQIVQFDDATHQPVHAHRHGNGDGAQHHHLPAEIGRGDRAQGNGDDFGRQDEVSAHRAFDLVALEADHVGGRVGQGPHLLFMVGLVLVCGMQKAVGQLFGPLETQEGPAQHQQRRDGPGCHCADEQRRRHQDRLVDHRPLGHRPHHRQFTLGAYPGDLLGIQREVIAQHPRRLLGSDLGHHRHVVQDSGNVVDQGQQTGSGHGDSLGLQELGGCEDTCSPIRAHSAAIDASEQTAHFAYKACCRPLAGSCLRPRAIEAHTTRA